MNRIFGLLLLIGIFMATTVDAQTIDRTTRPDAGPAPEIAFPPFESFTLDNGLKVYFVSESRPTVTMRLLVRGGEAASGQKVGLASFAADLLTKGAGRWDASTFADEIDFVGGSIGGSASDDAVTVTATGLKRHVPTILDLYSAAVMDPAYPEDELEKYRAQQIDGLRASKKESDFLARHAVNKVLYGESSLGTMPSEESLKAIDRSDVKMFHDAYFVPNNATLAVVGDFEPDELKEMLEEHFGSWSPADDVPSVDFSGTSGAGNRIVLVDRPTSVQSTIRVVGPGPGYTDEERSRSFILNSIYGGGTGLGNRLAMNLRETHGWTYSPYSYFSANMFGGKFIAGADVRNEVTDSAIAEMLSELDRLTSEEVGTEELHLNVKSSVGNYLMSLANPNITATRVQNIEFYDMPADYYDHLTRIYEATTPDHILDLASRYYDRDNLSIVVVGKADEVKEKLEQFGSVEVWDESLEPVKEVSSDELDVTAQEVWSRMLDGMGGKESMRNVTSIAASGSAQLSMGPRTVPGSYRLVKAYPTNEFFELTLSMGGQTMTAFEQYVNPDSVTLVEQGRPARIDPEEEEKRIAAAHLLSEAYLEELGGELELKGARTLEGEDVYVVGVSWSKAPAQTYYINQSDFLPVKVESEESSIAYLGWKDVGEGIKQPSGVVMVNGPAEVRVEEIDYTVNGNVDDKIFHPN